MKSKFLSLIFCLSVVISACKKEKAPENLLASIQTQIIGTWQVQSGVETIYDSNGKVVGTHDAGLASDLEYQIDATSLRNSEAPGSIFTYTLTNINNAITIAVAGESYQVSINNNTMIWSKEIQYRQQDYAKSIYKMQFKRL